MTAPENNILLRLEKVQRHYAGGRVKALDGIDLDIRRSDWVTITGASGSGKSTLLNLMSGLDHPDQGRIWFEGSSMEAGRTWTRIRSQAIGFVFQSFNLLPTLTALENVQVPLIPGRNSAKQRRIRAGELLERVGLSQAGDRRPGDLSGGECQRVAIARALANNPKLILADEPTGNLDSQSSAQIIDLLKEVHQEDSTTVVLVTHDPEVSGMGEHRIRLKDGQVVNQQRCGFDQPCDF